MNLFITGVTGLLGCNFLYEIIKENSDKLDTLRLTLLGRNCTQSTFKKRITLQIMDEINEYFNNKINKEKLLDFLQNQVTCIGADLGSIELSELSEQYPNLLSERYDHIFHIAALTDFRSSPKVAELLNRVNVEGTRSLLKLAEKMDLGQFNYVGSAYSCGKTYGNVKADYINLNQEFRNHYEKSKLEAEILVREFQKNSNIKCCFFRPSTIGGRAVEREIGKVNKFDVFYSLGAFFLKYRIKELGKSDNLYNKELKCPLRMQYNKNAGLNIVPADFAAKLMYKIAISDIDGDSFHLVSSSEYPHELFIKSIFNSCNIKGVTQTDIIPSTLNTIERFYYKTVGKLFKDYLIQPEIDFDISNLEDFYKEINITETALTDKNFDKMISFAQIHNFGIF